MNFSFLLSWPTLACRRGLGTSACLHVAPYLLCCSLPNPFLLPNLKKKGTALTSQTCRSSPILQPKIRFVKVEVEANKRDRIFYGFHSNYGCGLGLLQQPSHRCTNIQFAPNPRPVWKYKGPLCPHTNTLI